MKPEDETPMDRRILALHVAVGKPFGEAKRGDHEYVILVQGTNLLYTPSGATTLN